MEYFDRLYERIQTSEPERFGMRLAFLTGVLAPGDRVIDVGCGEGWFSGSLAELGYSVTGTDVAAEAIRRARERYPQLDFHLCGEASLPFADGSFELAWLGEVLEHVRDGLGLLGEVARVLAPGGRLAISTPAHGWSRRLWLGCSRAAFETHFEPRADHLRFFTAGTLRSLLDAAGFDAVRVRGRGGLLLAQARSRPLSARAAG